MLHVRTVPIEGVVDLIGHIPADVMAAWLHEREGMVALGAAARITTSGPDRFREASRRLRELAAVARVRDEVGVRGTGLVALGSFSYADSSPRPSELVVPAAILGVHQGQAFLTVASADAEPEEPGEDTWRELFPATPIGDPVRVDVEADHTPAEYQELVVECIRRIRAGEAGKIVLSATSTAHADEEIRPALVLARLAARFPSTWVYLAGNVIGASPEMLAEAESGRVHSRVLAGTRPVAAGNQLGAQERAAFLADPKERSEHAYAVDSVLERLVASADDVHAPTAPFVLALPGIEHLATDVTARLRPGSTALDIAAALHPSAAVSGTPRDRADAVIAELEPYDRGGYAAPVGWTDAAGDGQWAIALRMAHLRGGCEARIQAGGGIVEGSDPVVEHVETLAKMRPILSALRGDQ